MRADLAQYLEKQVERIPFSGCWIWMRAIGSAGYGTAYNGRNCSAHRLSYETFVGPIPEGMLVCHACDVRACINPSHLWLGDDLANSIDAIAKGRRPKSGCERGHASGALIPAVKIPEVRAAVFNRTGSLTELSLQLNISVHVLKDISRGRSYLPVGAPSTRKRDTKWKPNPERVLTRWRAKESWSNQT